MNTVITLVSAAVMGIVIALVIALIIKRYIASAAFVAGLNQDDRNEIVQMKVFLDDLRKERVVDREARAKTAGRIEAQIECLSRSTCTLGESANNLERALRGDAQVMGSWGEMQLKRVLEVSGLTEGVSYTYQESFCGEDSMRRNKRTDVQVKLPGDKIIVIDSKNTVPGYMDYNASETDEDRDANEEAIIRSVREHMNEIIAAEYQKSIKNCFPKVVMYFPFEIPYFMACRAQIVVNNRKVLLREYAYGKDIIFASASNLLPILEGVASVWSRQGQDQKIAGFLGEADKMCTKMATFTSTYVRIGKEIADLAKLYRVGMGQLAEGNGNVIKKLGELRDMGVPAAAKLPSETELIEHANKVADISQSQSETT